MRDDRRVVVIGSGPGGAAAATFLTRAGIDVTLLEAGPKRGAFGLTARVAGMTVAKLRRPLKLRTDGVTMTADTGAEFFEELSPGGLSNHWSCAVPRFSHEDFLDAARGGEGHAWPIGYDDLAPWYDRIEPLLHIAGGTIDSLQLPAGRVLHTRQLGRSWLPVALEARNAGRAVVPMPYAYGGATTVTFSGTAFNSFVRLVQPALRSRRLEVRYDARALRLEWSQKSGRVEAVLFRDRRTGIDERMPCKAVVVAAGAIASAQILLESTSPEFPNGLGNTHGVLGRYLHDHPLGKLVIELGSPFSIHPAGYVTRPLIEGTPPLYAAACMQWSGANLFAKSILARHPGLLPWIGFSVFGTMEPTLENSVALDPTRPRTADGTSALSFQIRHPPEAGVALTSARDQVLELFARAGLRPETRIWNVEAAGNSNHYGGTCRMHASPRYGMLDSWGRMHAVPNVVVADSSAFTTGPEKNPVLTSMALSARASDRLAHDLRTGAL